MNKDRGAGGADMITGMVQDAASVLNDGRCRS